MAWPPILMRGTSLCGIRAFRRPSGSFPNRAWKISLKSNIDPLAAGQSSAWLAISGGNIMTKIRRIDPGPRLSEALVCGDRLYTSGLVADDAVGPSVYLQTKDILRQIDSLLQGNGTSKTGILKANIWLADIGSFEEMNKAWDEWVTPGQAPVRATVESKLADPMYKVEIMFEALIGQETT